MAYGVTRWRDLQNILTTETEINNLAGLTAVASDLNRISGYLYTGAELNQAYESLASWNSHLLKDLATAHHLLPNSIDGGVLAGGTVNQSKLSFGVLTSADGLQLNLDIEAVESDVLNMQQSIDNIYSILIPGQGSDIAESINQVVAHIEKVKDAHDASAISLGNEYTSTSTVPVGGTQTTVSLDDIKFFKIGDTIALQSTINGPEQKIINAINYNTGHIGWTAPAAAQYSTSFSFVIHNLSQDNVQEGIDRSLRNTTDDFSGRLRITQNSTDDALHVINNGPGYLARYNDFSGKTEANYSLELGNNNSSSFWRVANSDNRTAVSFTDDGEGWLNTVTFEDRLTGFTGYTSKQTLTANRDWTFPDRSGYIGLGDLTFTELLKVRLVPATKNLTVAPGFLLDYEGQKMSAWISMEYPTEYPGDTIAIEAQFSAQGQLLGLGNNWQVFTVFINDSDQVSFFYGPQEAVRQDAIDNYENFIPSAFMKLAHLIVRGDGTGGILQNSIEILEDQRPFLTQGMSAAYYDESITYNSGFAAGGIIQLPFNSRGGGTVMTYRPGKSQLEVYLDGVYQREGIDFEETSGEPVGQIRMLKNIQSGSNLRFRVTYKAAAVAGGIDVETLQSVYTAGPNMNLSSLIGPIDIQSFDMNTLMKIHGDIELEGMVKLLEGLEFSKQITTPGVNNINQLYVNNNDKLIFHQYTLGQAYDWDLLAEIANSQSTVLVTVNNVSGATIAKGRGVALHASLSNHVVLCDTSNSLSTSRLVGVAFENIPSGGSGRIALGGQIPNAGIALPHKTVLVVDPRNPGLLINKDVAVFLPNDQYMEAGQLNGSSLIVDIDRNKKPDKVWRVEAAGEAFLPNVTKIVRVALNGETNGRFYKASKANANIDQKFWALAAVRPSQSTLAGDMIRLYKEIELAVSEPPFDAQDIGLPLYLDEDGSFKPWRLIKATYNVGDAIVKVGMIEGARKIIIDSVQMMGTAPGPMA